MVTTLKPPPTPITHWSARRLAAHLGVNCNFVQQVSRKRRLQAHRSRSFKFSLGPPLVEKVTDIVGPRLHPPEKAIVL